MGTYDTRGGAPRHDPEADEERPCDVCGKLADACQCNECPTCHTCGDPACYVEHGLSPVRNNITEMPYRRGFLARKRHHPESANPYSSGGGGSAGLQRHRAWNRGWHRADEGKPLQDYNG